MAQSIQNSHAVIVLAPGMHGAVRRQDHRRWLSRGRILAGGQAEEMLTGVLRAIEHSVPEEGLAALRFWGQTGERPAAWVAAADPVHLEARLDHLCLHALQPDEITPGEVCELFAYLQSTLGGDDRYTFSGLDRFGYLQGHDPLVTDRFSRPCEWPPARRVHACWRRACQPRPPAQRTANGAA